MRRPAAILAALIAWWAAAAGAAYGQGPAVTGPAPDRWQAPVPGAVTRGFEPGPPFEGAHHRGVDLAAPPGSVVRAACGGPVMVARRVGSSGRVVTVRCGPWRVSVLPLAQVAVREGATVARGARLGTAAAGQDHAGLHLGVRREGRRFGYADPLRFLGTEPLAPPPLGSPPGARRSPHGPRAGGPPAVRPKPIPAGSNPAGPPLAPWPAWLGLALLLAGAAGAGVRRAAPRSRATGVRTVPSPVVERVP
jgi:murein DD-endopeptidase MepM/ murein hydrolase activator NlpD